MANLTPGQAATRDRVEGMIALAAPFLDLVLGVGERISRIAEPTDHEYYPIRPGGRVALPGESGYDADADLGAVEPGPTGTGAGPAQSE
jgi:hypothetical protein